MDISKIIITAIAVVMLTGCAMSYKATSPQSAFQDMNVSENGGVSIVCSEIDVVSAGNKWLGKKLSKAGFVMVPVKVVNQSDKLFELSSENIEFINDYTPVEMVPHASYAKVLKQKWWPNLLLIPVIIVSSYKKDVKEIPGSGTYISTGLRINLFSGAVALWGIVNTGRTIYANIRSEKDILKNDLLNKTILPGTVEYGFICVKSDVIINPMVRIKGQ